MHDVANGADFFIECAAAFDAELLGHRDLHVLDVVAIPDRFQKSIGEAEIHKVLHRFLAKVVIDSKDCGFWKHLVQRAIERLSGREIAPERLLDDHPRILGASRFSETLHDARKHARGNGEVMDGPGRKTQCLLQFGECLRIRVIAVHIAQLRCEFFEAAGLEVLSAVLDARARALLEFFQSPARARHSDDRNA